MLQDVLLTDEERSLKQEVREFVKNEVPSDLVKKMDWDEITYPREFAEALGESNLLGLRFLKEYGGRGSSLGTASRERGQKICHRYVLGGLQPVHANYRRHWLHQHIPH